MDVVCITEKQLLSRLLYANPVCLLTTPGIVKLPGNSLSCGNAEDQILSQQNETYPNIMTVSWLTPVDNSGGIIMCLNSKRNTCGRIQSALSKFVLNVPVAGMENMILNIGSCSGNDVDKYAAFDISLCNPGWNTSIQELHSDPMKLHGKRLKEYQRNVVSNILPAIEACVAHIVCETRSFTHETQLGIEGDSIVFTSKILFAYVRSSYWNGKNFIPADISSPPYLSFLGTKNFAYICSNHLDDMKNADNVEDSGGIIGRKDDNLKQTWNCVEHEAS